MVCNRLISRKQLSKISEKKLPGVFIFKLFISEYYATMISLAVLCALLYYVIKLHLERLFDFMLFVAIWLQLELAYRQWWLEMKHREPYPVFELFELSDSQELIDGITIVPPFIKFYFTNAGASPAHCVYVKVIAIRKEFSAILSRKTQLIKHIPQRVCSTQIKRAFIPPGEVAIIPIELHYIEKCAQDDEQVLYALCTQSVRSTEICTQIAEITTLGKDVQIYRIFNLREEPPGIILKSPNLVKDAFLYYQAYKAGKSSSLA
ncbi:MAG: hypothetical protein LM590_08395 [Thermofilum sp.]|nr:hypothetical protein [Thermofilum sp.]